MTKRLEERMEALCDAIQIEIDKEFDPEAKFYRPVGTWRDNWEDGFKAAIKEVEGEIKRAIEMIEHGYGDGRTDYAVKMLKTLIGEGDD